MKRPSKFSVFIATMVIILVAGLSIDRDEEKTPRKYDEVQDLETKIVAQNIKLLEKDMIIQGLVLSLREQIGSQDELRALYVKHSQYIKEINEYIIGIGGPEILPNNTIKEVVGG